MCHFIGYTIGAILIAILSLIFAIILKEFISACVRTNEVSPEPIVSFRPNNLTQRSTIDLNNVV